MSYRYNPLLLTINNIAANGVQNSLRGTYNAFVVKFDTTGIRKWGSYFGGNNIDPYSSMAVFRRNIYLCGTTNSSSGVALNGYQNTFGAVYDGFLARIIDTPAIITDSLSRLMLCTGDTLKVPYHAWGGFNPGNVFTAQLSDSSGSFASPVAIGALISTNGIDTITAVIPPATIPGTHFRIRVVSSNQTMKGKDNRQDITINSIPAQPGPINGADSACTGSSQLYNVAPVARATTYTWSLPPTWIGSSNTDSILTVAGTSGGIISVSASNACGTSVPRTLLVVAGVNLLVTPTISIVPHPPVCSRKLNAFVAAIKNGGLTPIFQWRKNGVSVGTNSNVYFDSTLVNGDIISVTLTSNAVCTTQAYAVSADDTVIVGPATVPGININTIPPYILCQGTSVTFITNSVGGGATPTFQWYKNGIPLPGQTSASYTDSSLANGDTLVIAMRSSAQCPVTQPTFSNRVGVTVYPNVPTAVSITASPDTIGTNGLPVTFTATPVYGGPNPSYIWYLNGMPIPYDTTDTWIANNLQEGDVVSVRMESRADCPAPAIVWSAPRTMHTYTTGIATIGGKRVIVAVYPNPVSGSCGWVICLSRKPWGTELYG